MMNDIRESDEVASKQGATGWKAKSGCRGCGKSKVLKYIDSYFWYIHGIPSILTIMKCSNCGVFCCIVKEQTNHESKRMEYYNQHPKKTPRRKFFSRMKKPY